MIKKLVQTLGPALFAVALNAAFAQEHLEGALGPTHPIAEPDAVEQIMAHLGRMRDSGELDRWQGRSIEQVKKTIEEPPGVHLPRATFPRMWTFDPTIVAQQDITVEGVGTLVKAGTRVNPLDYVPFHQIWVFFDASDPVQVAYARRFFLDTKGIVKPVVVSGRWADVARQWKEPVFFDQHGDYVARFGIRTLPATLRRQGSVLQLDELVVTQ
jgi:conjugal transfer pilus assembly protein TraW